MLHTETVEPGTFFLLKELMDLPALEAFQAILGRAQKKDFWNLHELLQLYTLQ
jgi:hypothetical protein